MTQGGEGVEGGGKAREKRREWVGEGDEQAICGGGEGSPGQGRTCGPKNGCHETLELQGEGLGRGRGYSEKSPRQWRPLASAENRV